MGTTTFTGAVRSESTFKVRKQGFNEWRNH